MTDHTGVPPAPSSAQPAPAKTAAKKRRKWPWILAAILVLGILIVLLLPTILSTSPFLHVALAQANQRINGKVEMESWSLGWFSGFKLEGIRVSDADGRPVIEIKSLSLPASVPALLRAQKDIGTLDVEAPKADIVLYADGTNNLMKLIKQTGAPAAAALSKGPKPQAQSPAQAQPMGFDLVGAVAVRNGQVTVHLPQPGAKPFVVGDLNMDVAIASLAKPIRLDVKAAIGEERAPLTINASATLLHDGKLDPSALEAEVKAGLTGLDLAPLSAMARPYGLPVEAAGTLTATLAAQVKGQYSVAAQGEVTVNALSLSGGPLGKDQPKFDRVGLAFDVAKTDQTVTIRRLQFDSPVCSASASGALEPQAGNLPRGKLAAHAELDLKALAAQLSDTMRLQQGLTIDSGKVTLDSTLASDEKERRVEAALKVENLAAIREGTRVALEAPIALTLRASQTDKGPRLDDLEFTSSFAAAHGSGTLEQFSLEVTSDLAAAMREAAKFVALGGKTAQGQARLAFSLSGADPRTKNISGDVAVAGLRLTGFTPGPIQLDEAKGTLAATAQLNADGSLQKISGLKCEFAAGKIAGGSLSAESITLTPAPAVSNVNAALDSDLAEVSRFAHDTGLMPAAQGLAGRAHVALAMSGSSPQQQNLSGELTLTGLELSGFTPQAVRLDKVNGTLAAAAQLNADGSLREISGLKLAFAADKIADGGFSAESIAVTPGQALPTLTNGSATLNSDLAEVTRFARGLGLMPAAVALGGQVACSAGLAVDKGGVRVEKISVTVTDLDVAQGERHVREPKITLTGAAELNPAARSAAIHGLTCQFAAGSLSVESVTVPDWVSAPAGIAATLKGDFDLAKLLSWLKDFAPLPAGTTVAGQAAFTLKATAAAATQHVTLQAALTGLKVASGSAKPVEDNRITLDADADIAPGAATATMNSLTVASGFFNLSAKGALNDWAKARDLKADGTLQCDWDKIGALASAFSGQPIEMSGTESREFHVRTSLAGADWRAILAKTDCTAGFQVATFKIMGIDMTVLGVPIVVKDNLLSAKIEAGVNGGNALFPAQVDASKTPPELTLPADTTILKDVKLTSDMADAALSRVSPIFKGCTAAGGTIALDAHSLNVPLATGPGSDILKSASYDGGLTFRGVSMQGSGMLQTVLQLCGGASGGAQLLSLPDQRVTLALRDGRIIQGPMQIAAGNYRLTISGSVGLEDKSLDMVVELPVSREMLGGRDDLYQLLKGQVIRLPVQGTTDNPKISKDAFSDNLKRLITAAGKQLIQQQGSNMLQNLFKR